MTPPAKADVGGSSGKLGLEVESVPCYIRVLSSVLSTGYTHSTESDRISSASWSSVPRECHRSAHPPDRIDEVIVVENPQGIYTGYARVCALLPIDPPEVDTFVLKWVMQGTHVRREELARGTIEVDRLSSALA